MLWRKAKSKDEMRDGELKEADLDSTRKEGAQLFQAKMPPSMRNAVLCTFPIDFAKPIASHSGIYGVHWKSQLENRGIPLDLRGIPSREWNSITLPMEKSTFPICANSLVSLLLANKANIKEKEDVNLPSH